MESLVIEVLDFSSTLVTEIMESKADVVVVYTDDETILRDYPKTDAYNLVPKFMPERKGIMIEPMVVREIHKLLRSVPENTEYYFGDSKTVQAVQCGYKDTITEERAIAILAFKLKAKLDYFYTSDYSPLKILDELEQTPEILRVRNEIIRSMEDGWKHGIYSETRGTTIRELGVTVTMRDTV